jgi:hypothetical protein
MFFTGWKIRASRRRDAIQQKIGRGLDDRPRKSRLYLGVLVTKFNLRQWLLAQAQKGAAEWNFPKAFP